MRHTLIYLNAYIDIFMPHFKSKQITWKELWVCWWYDCKFQPYWQMYYHINFSNFFLDVSIFTITSEGNPWLCHSSHPWHLAWPPAAAALACFFKEQEAGGSKGLKYLILKINLKKKQIQCWWVKECILVSGP